MRWEGVRLGLKLRDWPDPDRGDWEAAVRPGNVFRNPGGGRHWAEATRRRYAGAWLPTDGALFSRSYEGNLPSSFTIVLSSALVYSTSPPVSVSGTVYSAGLFPGCPSLHTQSDKGIQLTAIVTSARPRTINLVPIDYAFQPRLRGRLTLRGLTLRRNPWTFGDSVSHTVCRYS